MKKEFPFAGLVVFVGLFFYFLTPLILLQKSFIVADYEVQHLPWAWHYFRCLRAGELPFWTSLMTCGFPLLAEGQIGAFYPLNLLAYKFLPFIAAYTWSVPIHMFAGGLGMYLYARTMKLSEQASMLAAIGFVFGSDFAGCAFNIGSLRTLCWLPWALFIFEKRVVALPGFKRRSLFVLAAVLLACQWTAGFSQMAVYSFLYCLCHECIPSSGRKPDLKRGLICLSAIITGTLLALPQILLTAELIGQSIRQTSGTYFALWGSMTPAALISLIFPQWGNALRSSFYIGIPLFLFTAAFLYFRNNRAVFIKHGLLFVFFLTLALGKFNPFYAFIVEKAHLSFLRIPSKFIFFSVLSHSMFAGAGFDRLVSGRLEGRAKLRLENFLKYLAVAVCLLPLTLRLCLAGAEPLWEKYSRWYIAKVIAQKGDLAGPPAYYADVMARFFTNLKTLFSYANLSTLTACLLTALTVWLIRFHLKGALNRKKFIAFSFALIFIDLAVFGSTLGTGFIGNAGSLKDLEVKNTTRIRLAAGIQGDPLIIEFASGETVEKFRPNVPMQLGWTHPGGYSPLLLKKYYDLVYDLGILDGSLGRAPMDENVWREERGLLDILGVGYIFSDREISFRDLEREKKTRGYTLYKNKTVVPLMAVYEDWKVIENEADRLRFLKSTDFDPARQIVLSAPLTGAPNGTGNAGFRTAKIISRKNDEIIASVDAGPDGMVFTRVAAYPGWGVWVDGQKTPVGIVNHAFLGFKISGGPHSIRMAYIPTDFRFAMTASAACFVILLIWLCVPFRRFKTASF